MPLGSLSRPRSGHSEVLSGVAGSLWSLPVPRSPPTHVNRRTGRERDSGRWHGTLAGSGAAVDQGPGAPNVGIAARLPRLGDPGALSARERTGRSVLVGAGRRHRERRWREVAWARHCAARALSPRAQPRTPGGRRRRARPARRRTPQPCAPPNPSAEICTPSSDSAPNTHESPANAGLSADRGDRIWTCDRPAPSVSRSGPNRPICPESSAVRNSWALDGVRVSPRFVPRRLAPRRSPACEVWA
jgi:hypothetical protein